MIPENVFLLVTSATMLIKIVVDAIRIAVPSRPSWVSPVLAIGMGPLIMILLMVSNGDVLTQVTIAQSIIGGILAGGAAIGVTEVQKRSN